MVCYLIALRMAYVAYLKADAGLAGLNDSINAVLFDGTGILPNSPVKGSAFAGVIENRGLPTHNFCFEKRYSYCFLRNSSSRLGS